jgi:ubiquinone/menaquinone biosynthesis C-methylase UbiE
MTAPLEQVRNDFDRIAILTERHGSLNDVYHNQLKGHLPTPIETALEIGCGTGEFTRLMADRAKSVVAIDLSSQMIRLAKTQSSSRQNIEYVLGDVMSLALPAERFDCVVSLATLHHLPLAQAILKMKGALKPDGVLIIHDLLAADGLVDKAISALAYPISAARRFWKTARLRAPREVRDGWNDHGRGEVYLTLNQVKEMCDRYLPEARIQRHLLWRYTVVWHKRSAA